MYPRTALSIGSLLCIALLMLVTPVAHAQAARGIFVTPIAGAPFSGTVTVQRSIVQADGSELHLWSERQIARDSAGRIYSEFRALMPTRISAPPPLIRVLLYDPQNRMSVTLFPQQKQYRMVMLNRPPRADTTEDFASPSAQSDPPSQFAHKEDLGDKVIDGLRAHGVRITQKVPAEASGTGAAVTVTDEYWYSDDLRINLKSTHADPRTGTMDFTLTGISHNDPDEKLFAVPADYTLATR